MSGLAGPPAQEERDRDHYPPGAASNPEQGTATARAGAEAAEEAQQTLAEHRQQAEQDSVDRDKDRREPFAVRGKDVALLQEEHHPAERRAQQGGPSPGGFGAPQQRRG